MTERLVCDDLASSFAIRPDDVIEWYDGPVIAAVRCPRCDSCAILELVDWEPPHRVRIYAMRPVSRDALDLYFRDLVRGSCDPSRRESELHALLCAAGAPARIVAYDGAGRAPIASQPFPVGVSLPSTPWRERIPEASDHRWFDFAGVPKRADSPS